MASAEGTALSGTGMRTSLVRKNGRVHGGLYRATSYFGACKTRCNLDYGSAALKCSGLIENVQAMIDNEITKVYMTEG
eukprot:6210562-Pleurochrysis_carterae.AAC.4